MILTCKTIGCDASFEYDNSQSEFIGNYICGKCLQKEGTEVKVNNQEIYVYGPITIEGYGFLFDER